MADKTKVLIVDDEEGFCNSIIDILIEKGYDAYAVNSGAEALEKIKETLFDVVLMDIKMPVMNGVDAFKEIKKVSPQTVVIMMTAYSVEDLIKDALKEGAYGVLYKPLDIDRVIKMIEVSKREGALIMVVDDDANTRESLKDILEGKGYVVTLAKDGEEAIKIAKERPEDIVFIDMKLPVLNGLETYLALRKANPEIIAVMITGYREEMKYLIEEALKNSAYACLYKPLAPPKILDVIKKIIKIKKYGLKHKR